MPSYEVTAEFYDVLQATEHLRATSALLDRRLAEPRVGVLDIGAGTGLATILLAQRTHVIVHAVEPAAAMRAVLLSRLADHSDLLARVRVHAGPVQRLGLTDAADFALCLNTMGTFDADDRHTALAALAQALVPGGTLLVQRPPESPELGVHVLPAWRLGGDTYGGEVAANPIDQSMIEWRFTYRVMRGGMLVREETEAFTGYLASVKAFETELGRAGFDVVDMDEPDVAVARLR